MMVNVFHSDAGCNVTMKAVMLVVLAVVSLGVLIGCQTVLKQPGEPVSSGEFYDFVVHIYTKVLPPLIEACDWEQFLASGLVDRERWKLKDEDGKIWDLTSRGNYWKQRCSERLGKGIISNISYKIKKVTMTDATHSTVLRIYINDWENADRTRRRRFRRPGITYWEKIDGQWLAVYTEHGRGY